MRHKKGNAKLSKPTDQRLALIKGQVRSLFINDRITTTVVRAKEVRKVAEKLITLAKKNTLASKRNMVSVLGDRTVAHKIWKNTARFSKRSGGYTRIVHLGERPGDAAKVALLELVDISA